ncbi:MAG: MATE family efflux transporter [Defluviitoga tunisiensis]|jgi:putative MATE family efflux protein|nr:MATE family efflux transporter [Defluviitoga tunisiensis]HOK16805.1 MATE family efflux transporter [Defluviitoga tunisiensis]HOL86997.1 MATE family efflux transporter [Defluviitoga tunisiensis]
MKNNYLTNGPITKALVKLALPIMATSFVQMTYTMMDMIWLGRIGSNAVAASGTVGFFTWIGSALFILSKIAVEVGVAQSLGKDDIHAAREYVRHSIQLDIIIALVYTAILIIFRNSMIGFFRIDDQEVVQMALDYLVIISIGLIFYFINPVLSGVFNGVGDSVTPFKVNVVGLIVNMVLDPLMILGIGPFPYMGIKGAAWATVIAQATVTFLFIFECRKLTSLFSGLNIFKLPKKEYLKSIVKLGVPVSIQNVIFATISMFLARIIAQWGYQAIAVQNVGSQIESISWMTAGGFSTAISTFVGQNYGAGKWDRIREGYKKGLMIVGIIGLIATFLFFFVPEPIIKIFIPTDREAIEIGINYLKILSLSQFFMVVEIATQGAFNGLGKTLPPSLVGIILNALRIPGALILSSTVLGLNGVWWSICISSILKGVILFIWLAIVLRSFPKSSLNEAYEEC